MKVKSFKVPFKAIGKAVMIAMTQTKGIAKW
ncbi:Uncharacterised protein [Staphylococcus aureus]|nr:Uncharacterised protein [Staphylococcus aureus]